MWAQASPESLPVQLITSGALWVLLSDEERWLPYSESRSRCQSWCEYLRANISSVIWSCSPVVLDIFALFTPLSTGDKSLLKVEPRAKNVPRSYLEFGAFIKYSAQPQMGSKWTLLSLLVYFIKKQWENTQGSFVLFFLLKCSLSNLPKWKLSWRKHWSKKKPTTTTTNLIRCKHRDIWRIRKADYKQ